MTTVGSGSDHLFDQMKRYVGFGPDDECVLRELSASIEPSFASIVEQFYRRIDADPVASAVMAGGPTQAARLQATMRVWLAELFTGPWDSAYFDRRAQIGRRHVEIRMPQHLNFTAMSVLREQLVRACEQSASDATTALLRITSINKLLDLELAIILHTYAEDHQAQLRRHERLATFGQMTSSIAHELRNPLGVVESSAYLLRQKLAADPAALRHVEKIHVQVARSNAIIASMLAIIRDRAPVRVRISPVQLVERAVSRVLEDLGVAVDVQVDGRVSDLLGDSDQLQQVLWNLLLNAHEACGRDGTVCVRVVERAGRVELVVEDDGPGVDPALRDRMFEPLVTSKEAGTGLGLALCRNVVEAHGGTLALGAPEVLSGAAFVVSLPAAGKAAVPQP